MSENVFNDSTLFDNGAPEVGNEVELAGDPPQEDATKATPKNSRRATSKAPSAPKRGRVSAPAAEKALESEAQPPPPPAQPYYAQPAPQQPQYPMMPQYGMQYGGQPLQQQQQQYAVQYPAPQPGYQQPKRNAFAEGIYAQLPVEAKQAAAERDYARAEEGGRIATTTSQAAANGARIGDHFERSYKEENWAFTVQKWLSFHLCEPCTRLFLCDNGRVQHLGGGYRLLSFVACPACMRNNNEIKRMYKEYFPTSYRSQQ